MKSVFFCVCVFFSQSLNFCSCMFLVWPERGNGERIWKDNHGIFVMRESDAQSCTGHFHCHWWCGSTTRVALCCMCLRHDVWTNLCTELNILNLKDSNIPLRPFKNYHGHWDQADEPKGTEPLFKTAMMYISLKMLYCIKPFKQS